MFSTGDRQRLAVPSTDFEALTEALLMPIRIKRRDKGPHEVQGPETPAFTPHSFAERTACYTGRKEETRILCGSI